MKVGANTGPPPPPAPPLILILTKGSFPPVGFPPLKLGSWDFKCQEVLEDWEIQEVVLAVLKKTKGNLSYFS